jgi:hypothetical protein
MHTRARPRAHTHTHTRTRAPMHARTRIVRLISEIFPRIKSNLKPSSKIPFKPFKTRFLAVLYGR